MAQAVVDGLEIVEVHEDDGEPAALAPCTGDSVPNTFLEQGAVGQVGDRVVEGLMGKLLLEGLALAHVTAVEHDALDVLVVEQVRAEHLEAPRAAIAMPQHAVEDLRNGLGRGWHGR